MVHLDRPLDIVVYGATGFTGSLVAKYLKDHASHIKLGLGGRSEEKLKKVAEETGAKDAEIIVADTKDAAALKEMVKKTKAVITLVSRPAMTAKSPLSCCLHRWGRTACTATR